MATRKTNRVLFVLLNIGVACLMATCVQGPAIDASAVARNIEHREIIYRDIDGHALRMDVFAPPDVQPGETRPAVVCFHGGAWVHGSRRAFYPHCRYLAENGFVAVAVEYRTKFGHGGTVCEAITDGRAAIRYVREHANELNVDPKCVAAMGGSAGAHIALSTALIDCFDTSDTLTRAEPNAVVAFSPPSNTTYAGWPGARKSLFNTARYEIVFGKEDRRTAPVYCLPKKTAPMLLFHSRMDGVVPIEQSIIFAEEMRACGNECELVEFDNARHPFFESKRSRHLHEAMERAVEFLKQM